MGAMSYATTNSPTLSREEREVIALIRKVQTEGAGFGSVVVTIKNRKVVTAREEQITIFTAKEQPMRK